MSVHVSIDGARLKGLLMPDGARTARRRAPRRKDEIIQIRASADTKAILNRAASLRGQKLSEFMLESARQRAEETVLDQRVFFLEPRAHERFLALLDTPPRPSEEARQRLTRKAAWEP
jgi:uncharacterized protein (DUF1778 family)